MQWRFPAVFAGVAMLAAVASAAAPPETSISSGPEGPSASRGAKFRFAATPSRVDFQCDLDGKGWKACESPTKYSRLKQGAHTFSVRARKGGAIDPTPATRSFTVDTKPPDTSIVGGPTGETDDHTPEFALSSTEPGSFECKLGPPGYEPCGSPFVPASELPDESYLLRVRARDEAGNLDETPASRSFAVETPITVSLGAAQAAASTYFPDSIDFDVPASCGGSPAADCVNGQPLPPADQLRMSSTRSLTEVVGASRFDLSVTSTVETLVPIKLDLPVVGQCDLTMTSANGATPTWRFDVPLNFVVDPVDGDYRIVPGDPAISQFENQDYLLGGSFGCTFANLGSGFFSGLMQDWLASVLIGGSLCAAPGPEYLRRCPPP